MILLNLSLSFPIISSIVLGILGIFLIIFGNKLIKIWIPIIVGILFGIIGLTSFYYLSFINSKSSEILQISILIMLIIIGIILGIFLGQFPFILSMSCGAVWGYFLGIIFA